MNNRRDCHGHAMSSFSPRSALRRGCRFQLSELPGLSSNDRNRSIGTMMGRARQERAGMSAKARVTAAVGLFLTAVLFASAISSVQAIANSEPVQLPRVEMKVAAPVVSGRSIAVGAGGNLQAALDSARAGDEIVLQAGATFVGSFRLRNHGGDGWITVRSTGPLPPSAQRASAQHRGGMATLMTPGSNRSVVTTEPGAWQRSHQT